MQNNIFNSEELLETGKSLVKSAGDQAVKQAKTTVNTALGQLTGSLLGGTTNENQNQQQAANQQQQDDNTKDIVKNLYGIGNTNNQSPQPQLKNADGTIPQTPEEMKKAAEVRKLLNEQHMSAYYKPTFEPPKPVEKSDAERLEEEKQNDEKKKMEDLQVKQKKEEESIAIRMNSQKAEKFPGAAG